MILQFWQISATWEWLNYCGEMASSHTFYSKTLWCQNTLSIKCLLLS